MHTSEKNGVNEGGGNRAGRVGKVTLLQQDWEETIKIKWECKHEPVSNESFLIHLTLSLFKKQHKEMTSTAGTVAQQVQPLLAKPAC